MVTAHVAPPSGPGRVLMRRATLAGLASPGSLGRARGSAASSKAAPRAARACGECAGCGPSGRRACLASTRDAPVPAPPLLSYPVLGSLGATRLRGARCSSSARPRRRRRAGPRACSLGRGPAVRLRHRPRSRRRRSSPWGALGRCAKVRSSSSQLARPSLANATHVQVGATGRRGGPCKREVLLSGWAQAKRAWTVGLGAIGDGPSVQGLYAELEPLQEQGDALCDWNSSGQEHALQEHGGGVTQPPSDCPPGHSRHDDGIRARLWHAPQL